MTVLKIQRHFDAAHILPEHPGKCSNLHGHTYTIHLAVEHERPFIDFLEIKEILDEILEKLDHRCLLPAAWHGLEIPDTYVVRIPGQPTAENIAKWILENFRKKFHHLATVRVGVEEGRGSIAEEETICL